MLKLYFQNFKLLSNISFERDVSQHGNMKLKRDVVTLHSSDLERGAILYIIYINVKLTCDVTVGIAI